MLASAPPGKVFDMKKLTTDIAPHAGALVLLVSLVGMVLSLTAGGVVEPVAGVGMALGVILMVWGTFNSFGMQEGSGVQLREAVERIRSARHS